RRERVRRTGSVGAAEDYPLAVGRGQIAADANAGFRRAVKRDAAGRGRGRGLDLFLALLSAALQGAGPADGRRGGELVPVVGGEGVLVTERGGPFEQEVLEGVQFVGQA